MKKLKEKFKSVRFRLFIILCIIVTVLVIGLIFINNLVLGNFYIYSKTNTIKQVYNKINKYYLNPDLETNLENELKKIAIRNNFDILIKTDTNLILFSTSKDLMPNINMLNNMKQTFSEDKTGVIYKNEDMIIKKVEDNKNNLNYILLTGKLVNGYTLYIRIQIAPIQESVRISNNALITIGIIILTISGFVVFLISRKATDPILELNNITKKMAKLDFSQKYRTTDSDDEINELGKNINTMSDKLEATIKELTKNNKELEKDIEEKSKIDEMRKQFISDVSHDLKTPIALIQGYAEGLIENVNTDEASRKFYAEVILDESNKMDILVKQLIELMKLEYGKQEFNDKEFNIVELINEVIRKCKVMFEENKIEVIFDKQNSINVFADNFYIDRIVTNYITNAIKNVKEIDGKKQIKITIKEQNDKIRVYVFNTGEKILEEDLDRIWVRFYKVDTSRDRRISGSGIGLSMVKAIQNNYKNEYGATNKENGVEFYFDVNKTNR